MSTQPMPLRLRRPVATRVLDAQDDLRVPHEVVGDVRTVDEPAQPRAGEIPPLPDERVIGEACRRLAQPLDVAARRGDAVLLDAVEEDVFDIAFGFGRKDDP